MIFPDILQIHTDQELTKKTIESFHGIGCQCESDQGRRELEKKILEMSGIESLQITRYTFYITKGKAFNWDNLIEPIVRAITLAMDPVNGLEQTEPAVEYYLPTISDKEWSRKYGSTPIPPVYNPLKSAVSTKQLPPPPPPPL